MGQLQSIVGFIDAILEPAQFQDDALNGLVVEGGNEYVRTIAYSVDVGLSIIEQAIRHEADLLITHHPLQYGLGYYPITGAYGKKVAALLRHRCSLYCSHLPLDGNLELGNAAELARFIGAHSIEGFCKERGAFIGAKAQFQKAKNIDDIVEQLKLLPGVVGPLVFPFGKNQIKSVGIVTGAGGFGMHECAALGLDLLISGEPKQHEYHTAKELGVSAIFAGHYATEVFGVKALSELVAKQFGIKCIFIDEPTGV